MLIKPRKNNVDIPERRVPPRYKYVLSSAHNALKVKQMKMTQVAKNAVVTMLGLILITASNNGPIDKPVQLAKPNKHPKRVIWFFDSFGVNASPSMNPIPPRRASIPKFNPLYK